MFAGTYHHGINAMITYSVVCFKPKNFDFVHPTISPHEGVWFGHETIQNN